jgi:glutamate synthase (ferredoxin)
MQTIVYKGMLRSVVLGAFYEDLRNPEYESAFVIYHRRFSTNTNPKWPLAQPMRVLGHNGEINTVQVRAPVAAARTCSHLPHPCAPVATLCTCSCFTRRARRRATSTGWRLGRMS